MNRIGPLANLRFCGKKNKEVKPSDQKLGLILDRVDANSLDLPNLGAIATVDFQGSYAHDIYGKLCDVFVITPAKGQEKSIKEKITGESRVIDMPTEKTIQAFIFEMTESGKKFADYCLENCNKCLKNAVENCSERLH